MEEKRAERKLRFPISSLADFHAMPQLTEQVKEAMVSPIQKWV